MKIKNITPLFKKLQLKPNNTNLYLEALTHKTFSNENKKYKSYEKLEFLGDSILQMYSTLYICKRFGNFPEGSMSIIRAKNVSSEALAQIVKENGINDFLICSNNVEELKNNTKICSDIFESLLAAIYLDQGEETAWKFLNRYLFKKIKITKTQDSILKDPKTRLQELLQPIYKNPVHYESIKKNDMWHCMAICADNIYGVGKGNTKKEAEIAAAKSALSKLKIK